ncbi:MAG: hypothetical protein U0790_00045 [Isosphaeraceae bacterium]
MYRIDTADRMVFCDCEFAEAQLQGLKELGFNIVAGARLELDLLFQGLIWQEGEEKPGPFAAYKSTSDPNLYTIAPENKTPDGFEYVKPSHVLAQNTNDAFKLLALVMPGKKPQIEALKELGSE